METLTREELAELISAREKPSVSIYLPTEDAVKDILQPKIELKNLIKQAEAVLETMGLKPEELSDIFRPLHELVEKTSFWYTSDMSRAFFINRNSVQSYNLPVATERKAHVGESFYIKPLIPLFNSNNLYYILSLDKKDIALFQCSELAIRRIKVSGLPAGMDEILQYEDPDKQLQFHTGAGEKKGRDGRRAAVFHGHGSGFDDNNALMKELLHRVENIVTDYLNRNNAPLLLAGDEQVIAEYRKINKYAMALDQGIPEVFPEGNENKLHERSLPIIKPVFFNSTLEAIDEYQNQKNLGKTSETIEDIVVSSFEGRIKYLMTDLTLSRWGTFNGQKRQVEIHNEKINGDEDLINTAIGYTILNDGDVFTFDNEKIPEIQPLAAVYRY